MNWISSRSRNRQFSLREVLFHGLAPDGGLFMPTNFPDISPNAKGESLPQTALEFLRPYFSPDIPEDELGNLLKEALNFDIPLRKLSDSIYVLELFHGPTLAFKDVGARTMAGMMDYLYDGDEPLTILAATSGDTGSAVASAFLGREKFRVVLLYPSGKVSKVQEQQLTTFGQNVTALEIDGNFDDCQKLVKQAFSDPEVRKSVNLTSANSINIGRWLPQAVYYVHCWQQFNQQNSGDNKPVVSVPSGNLGNLAAGLVAKRHGADFEKLIGACNANATFRDFIKTDKYRPRSSVRTLSNAMDVGNPSNFERIDEMYSGDTNTIRKHVGSDSFSDAKTLEMIVRIKEEFNYLICPHTAVGFAALFESSTFAEKNHPGIVLSTAHPAKFGDVIEQALAEPVPLPEVLKNAVNAEKQSVLMKADYEAFKAFLM